MSVWLGNKYPKCCIMQSVPWFSGSCSPSQRSSRVQWGSGLEGTINYAYRGLLSNITWLWTGCYQSYLCWGPETNITWPWTGCYQSYLYWGPETNITWPWTGCYQSYLYWGPDTNITRPWTGCYQSYLYWGPESNITWPWTGCYQSYFHWGLGSYITCTMLWTGWVGPGLSCMAVLSSWDICLVLRPQEQPCDLIAWAGLLAQLV